MYPIAKQLFDQVHSLVYLYKEKPFRLSSGKLSNHYFNCKKIVFHPQFLMMALQSICEELLPSYNIPTPEAVGGLTLGADPISYGISFYYWQKGFLCYPFVVRKEPKSHGTERWIEGEIESVREVLVVDDVVTTGSSTLKAIEAFRKSGKIVRYAVCLIDREEEGRENLKKEGVELLSLWKKSDFIS
ncbi:MAG: orotate phosphoribosyltransferase [Leptonema sp. (in: bacteria)]